MSDPVVAGNAVNGDRRRWWLLGGMSCVLGLMVLDETVVAVALPSISKDFGLSTSATHWIVNAYLLAFTCCVAIAGRVGDAFNRKWFFGAGAMLFVLASLLAALATSGTILIAARALQGVAAAMIFPTSLALVTAAFAPSERGTAFGYQTTVGGIFMASGPLVGGILTQALSWRMIFWIGIPVVVGITVLLWLIWTEEYQTETAEGETGSIGANTLGAVLLIAGLLAVVSAIMRGPETGWASASTLSLLAGGSLLLLVFVVRELRVSAPLLDLSLLKLPEFAGGTLIFAIFQLEKIAVFVFSAQFFQTHLGLSPIQSGTVVSLAILPTLGTSILLGKMTDKQGSRRTLSLGVAFHGGALVLFALAVTFDSFWLALAPLLLWGASMPSIAIPTRRQQMNSVAERQHAQAGGINLTFQFLGGCLGLAACSAFLVETGSYPLLFAAVGLVVLLCIPAAQRCMK